MRLDNRSLKEIYISERNKWFWYNAAKICRDQQTFDVWSRDWNDVCVSNGLDYSRVNGTASREVFCYIAKKAELKKSLVYEKGEDIRIVTKQEFLTSQMLFNNLAQKRFETNKKYIFYSVNPDKHEKIHANNSGEWGGGGGGGGLFFA